MTETNLGTDLPVCDYCADFLGGGPGGWYSLATSLEVCPAGSPTSFHEPIPSTIKGQK